MKFAALLRGINVGGSKKILMKDLTKLFEKLNFKNVVTYIQSGNVIFESDIVNKSELENLIEEEIKREFGYDVPTIVKDKNDFDFIIKANPYLSLIDSHRDKIYLSFLKTNPGKEKLNLLLELDFKPDNFEIKKDYIFVCYDEKASKSKLTNSLIENKLKVNATARNWKTTTRIYELLGD